MSSQAFSRRVKALNLQAGAAPTPEQALELREWLANGIEKPLPQFVSDAASLAGAIYHLTDEQWVIPAMKQAMAGAAMGMVYDAHVEKDKDTGAPLPNPNDKAIATLTGVTFFKRTKTNIMHNKFLVGGDKLLANGEKPERVICGSANYTTQGLTSQANLIHSFESSDLATLYYNRLQAAERQPDARQHGQGRRAGRRPFPSATPASARSSRQRKDSRATIGVDRDDRAGDPQGDELGRLLPVHADRQGVTRCLFRGRRRRQDDVRPCQPDRRRRNRN